MVEPYKELLLIFWEELDKYHVGRYFSDREWLLPVNRCARQMPNAVYHY